MKKKLYLIIKRFFDLICSILLLIALFPLLLIIGVAIKLDSRGPIIFKQLRTGKNGKQFYLYKFRSMHEDNDVNDHSKNDQLTKVGRFVRKFSLDELPQLLNILKGEMSFIGPRPWIIEYYEYFTKEQKKRLKVLPGITGLAQVSGRTCITIFERIKCDVKYVEKISLLLDLKILLKTFTFIFISDGNKSDKFVIKEELQILRKQCKKENALKNR